jgi:hypothetical protein
MPGTSSRRRTALLALAAAATLLADLAPATAKAATPAVSTIHMRASYDVDATLRVADRRLTGRVTISATNLAAVPIDHIELNTTMGPLGGLTLGQVTVGGLPASAVLRDQTIDVPLGGPLATGATVRVVVPFAATLRSTTGGSTWLFTRANGVVSLYRWVPWVSRPTPFDRPNFGDPFVTPVSPRVTLRLRTDVPTAVVVNGTRTSKSADGLTTTWVATNVRDLVVNAATDYRTRRASVGDTEVRVITRPGAPSSAILDAAVNAVTKLQARLGPAPWPVLRIVESSGGAGMEGPGIVWVPPGAPVANLRYLLMHEVAHQWFYGLVGNDQAREPFADEALTDAVARFLTGTRRASRCAQATLDKSIYRYSGACYYEQVYIQGGNLLDDARARIGTSTFWATLRRYLGGNRWGLVHTRTLLDALDRATPLDLARGWQSRFPTLY